MNIDTDPFGLEDLKNRPAWLRLEDQLQWYDTKSSRTPKW